MTDRAVVRGIDVVKARGFPCSWYVAVIATVVTLNVASRLSRCAVAIVTFVASIRRSFEHAAQVTALAWNDAMVAGKREPGHKVIKLTFRGSRGSRYQSQKKMRGQSDKAQDEQLPEYALGNSVPGRLLLAHRLALIFLNSMIELIVDK